MEHIMRNDSHGTLVGGELTFLRLKDILCREIAYGSLEGILFSVQEVHISLIIAAEASMRETIERPTVASISISMLSDGNLSFRDALFRSWKCMQ